MEAAFEKKLKKVSLSLHFLTLTLQGSPSHPTLALTRVPHRFLFMDLMTRDILQVAIACLGLV